jgi:hypothetical protein
MSDRARISALTSLVQSTNAGSYSLPTDVIEAHSVWQRLKQTQLPPLRELHVEDVAGRIVHSATSGETPDILGVGAEFDQVQAERRAYDHALTVLRLAVEQAGNAAVAAASDATERIITEHLRLAHDELMEQARETATLLKPYSDAAFRLDLQDIVAATSTKVRSAYLGLSALLERYRLIQQARTKANQVGLRTVEHEHAQLFATFEQPMAFFPTWKPPARIPLLPFPEDETARLLRLVSDQTAKAKPWFPTLAEQDAAWWGQFGEQITRANTNRHNARAMAEQAVGLESRDGTATTIPAPPSTVERQAAFAGRLFGTTGGVPVNGGAVEK